MDGHGRERTVDNYVVRLRRLVEQVPDEPRVSSACGRRYRYDPVDG